MGIEGWNQKPKVIQEAISGADFNHLSAAGRKGAERTNEIKTKKREESEILEEVAQEKSLAEEINLRKSTNEDILSSDGEVLDYPFQD